MNPEPFVETMRAELVAARHRLGVEQIPLAARIGISQPRLSQWETGTRTPSWPALVRWADALGFDLALIPQGGES